MLMSKKAAQGILERAVEREAGGIDVVAAKRLNARLEAKAARRRKYPDPFMEGIAIACADLVRLFDQPSTADARGDWDPDQLAVLPVDARSAGEFDHGVASRARRERIERGRGKRKSTGDLFEGRPIKAGDYVLLGGTSASMPGDWFLGCVLWAGDEDLLVNRSTQNGAAYRQLFSVYEVRAAGTISELSEIKELARKAVADLTAAVHEAEAELGRARGAVHAKLDLLAKGGLKIEAFDPPASVDHDIRERVAVEAVDTAEAS